jgi:hypothetical protein
LGRVSSVNIASLNEACVSVTTPSTGICSPGKTIKYSLVKPDQSGCLHPSAPAEH